MDCAQDSRNAKQQSTVEYVGRPTARPHIQRLMSWLCAVCLCRCVSWWSSREAHLLAMTWAPCCTCTRHGLPLPATTTRQQRRRWVDMPGTSGFFCPCNCVRAFASQGTVHRFGASEDTTTQDACRARGFATCMYIPVISHAIHIGGELPLVCQ